MQKTKKNWALRAMFLALAFTLISTCLLGGTMAKYTTTGSGTYKARIAKWGVEVNATGFGFFSDTYAKDDDSYTLVTNTVISAGGTSDKVVAPGTSGSAGTITISGTPEVASRVTFAVDTTASGIFVGTNKTAWTVANSVAYEPILWSVSGSGITPVTDGTFADLLTALGQFKVDFEPNVSIATALNTVNITWKWPYSVNATNDDRDTFLGNYGANYTIVLAFDVVVTQID